jgi:hypothetical protein
MVVPQSHGHGLAISVDPWMIPVQNQALILLKRGFLDQRPGRSESAIPTPCSQSILDTGGSVGVNLRCPGAEIGFLGEYGCETFLHPYQVRNAVVDIARLSDLCACFSIKSLSKSVLAQDKGRDIPPRRTCENTLST